MTIVIELPPQPKERPGFGNKHAYTPKRTREYEEAVRWICKGIVKKPLQGAVMVEVNFYVPIPKSWSKEKKRDALLGFIRPISRPDIDNLGKAILDGMNEICYVDDKQIVDLELHEYYGEPRTIVKVEEV